MTLVAALILGSVALGTQGLVFPLIIPAIGAVTAILGVFLTRVRPGDLRRGRVTSEEAPDHVAHRTPRQR